MNSFMLQQRRYQLLTLLLTMAALVFTSTAKTYSRHNYQKDLSSATPHALSTEKYR